MRACSFLYTSHGITWLAEKGHSFITKEPIVIPFKPASYGYQDYLTRGNELLTAQTRVYQMEPACTPSVIEERKSRNGITSKFSPDKCIYSINPHSNPNATQDMMYIGLATNTSHDHNDLAKRECKEPNLFLAIWAKSRNAHNRSDEFDLNTLYCKPSYHFQDREITVEGTNGFTVRAVSVGERTNFTQEDKIIDIFKFKRNVGLVAISAGGNPKYLSIHDLGSGSSFEDWGLDSLSSQIL